MSRAARDLHRRKFDNKMSRLREILSRCDDDAFVQLAWAVDMLQSAFGTDVRRYLYYPKEAATTKLDTPHTVFKWEIETLVTLLLSTPKYVRQPGLNRIYRCDQFGTMADAVNLLRETENHESGASLTPENVLMEMHRIGHRQFGWQRGFATSERLYRFVYVYAQGGCADYFAQAHGLTIQEFLHVGFLLFAQLHRYPWTRAVGVERFGIDAALIEKALPLFSRSLPEIRAETQSLIARAGQNGTLRTAYLPSPLRRFPIITAPQHKTYIAPLPQLIMFRMTAGLYYDIADGPKHLITEANNRFEEYARLVINAFFPRFEVLPSQRYGPTKKVKYDSPDVLIKDGERIVAVIECKATKLTYDAQFAENPIEEAERAYAQMVKGITQIWKFFSHVRRRVYADIPVANDAHGILLTMDAWMQASSELQRDAMALAKRQIEGDQEIIEADMRPVIFCSMQDLVDVMFVSDEDQFLTSLENVTVEKFLGWSLREVHGRPLVRNNGVSTR